MIEDDQVHVLGEGGVGRRVGLPPAVALEHGLMGHTGIDELARVVVSGPAHARITGNDRMACIAEPSGRGIPGSRSEADTRRRRGM